MRSGSFAFPRRATLLLATLPIAFAACAGTRPKPDDESVNVAEAVRKLPPEVRKSLAKDAFLQALWLDLQGQDMMGLDYMQEAAWNDPDDRWLQFALASRLREFRRSPEALALARRAMSLPGEETAEQWGLLAGLWLEAGARDSARAAWERTLQLDPRSREALVGLATLAEARGDMAEAASRYATLSEDYGEAARAIVGRAVALWTKAGRADSATTLLRRRWRDWKDPEEGESLARLLSGRGVADSAVALYDTLATLPDAEIPRMHLMAARAWMLGGRVDSARARLLPLSLQGFTEARITLGALLMDLDSLEESRRLFVGVVDDPQFGALACHYLGLVASERREYDSARTWFDRSLVKDPQRPDTWVHRGLVELETGAPDSAQAIFARMVRLWPNSPQARWMLGHSLGRLAERRSTLPTWDRPGPGKDTGAASIQLRAVAQLDTALSLDPALPRARFERAALLERMGARDSAYREFRQVVRESPEDGTALNYLAYMWAEDGIELERADSLVSRALSKDSANPAYLDTRAWIRHRRGQDEDALADVDRAIAEGEDDPVVLEHRAVILETLGRTEEARKAWEAVLEKSPDHPRALRALGRSR